MQEDMIDFPVSDLWRDHYAAQGLTYPSGRYSKKHGGHGGGESAEVKELQSIIQILRDQLAEIHLTAQHPHLAQTERPTPPKPSTFEE